MNANAKLWVEALRSGKYKQGRGGLCGDEEYCCLGVLCEVYQQHNNHRLQIEEKVCGREYDGQVFSPPHLVNEWAGLKSYKQLVLKNDVHQNTFEEIADYIESKEGQVELFHA